MGRKPVGRFDHEREEMVNLLRERKIVDENVLAAMARIDRREFVQELFANRSYDDSALPIGCSQTISQPYTVACMTQALRVKPNTRILEVGTGSGYQAAVLAEMGAKVFTIERHMELLIEARRRFDRLNYNIASRCGDGTLGWEEFSPFAGIIVTAGAPDVPPALRKQLADGGILVIPVGEQDVQTLVIVERRGDEFQTKTMAGFKFVPLIGKSGW
jgi:protein-L-isoaspartate(D-aspartate) O-methyltransferase